MSEHRGKPTLSLARSPWLKRQINSSRETACDSPLSRTFIEDKLQLLRGEIVVTELLPDLTYQQLPNATRVLATSPVCMQMPVTQVWGGTVRQRVHLVKRVITLFRAACRQNAQANTTSVQLAYLTGAQDQERTFSPKLEANRLKYAVASLQWGVHCNKLHVSPRFQPLDSTCT